ncbi:hypothetical protein DFH06DRAFT_1374930 [Mycena polygramma]|nr:hypothetical protein DFH06DRAFT_1374930 [Mycena polygramma]
MSSSFGSQTTKSIERPPRKFVLRHRRTIIACSYCRRRKIRCVTTEQPPTNPCAYCTRKGLTCEYVGADSCRHSRKGSPDLSVADRSDSGTDSSPPPSPPLWTPSMTPAYFSPLYLDQEAVDQSQHQFSPSAFRSAQPVLSPAPTFRRSHHEVSTQGATSLHHGYSFPPPNLVPHPNRRHSASGVDSNAYGLQAAHAYMYLSSRASSSHSPHPCPPGSPEFFVDYSQMPGLDDMGYKWPISGCSHG